MIQPNFENRIRIQQYFEIRIRSNLKNGIGIRPKHPDMAGTGTLILTLASTTSASRNNINVYINYLHFISHESIFLLQEAEIALYDVQFAEYLCHVQLVVIVRALGVHFFGSLLAFFGRSFFGTAISKTSFLFEIIDCYKSKKSCPF